MTWSTVARASLKAIGWLFKVTSPVPIYPPGRGIPAQGAFMADEHAATETPIMIKSRAVMSAANLNPHVFDVGQIFSIILSLFQGLAACKSPTPAPAPTPGPTPAGSPTAAEVHAAIANPGIAGRISLREAARKHVKNPAMVRHVITGVLTVGASSTVDDTSAMFKQAVGYPPA